MKLKSAFVLLLAACAYTLCAEVAGYAGFRTGKLLPEPRVLEVSKSPTPLSGKVAIRWATPTPPAEAAAALEVVEAIVGELPENPEGLDLEITLKISPDLPPQGYTLTVAENPNAQSATAEITGGSLRGVYYGAATLAQGVSLGDGGGAIPGIAKVEDFPEWEHRFVSDVMANSTDAHFLELAAKKIGGICLRTEGDWQSDEWFSQNAPQLAAMRKAHDLDLADVMIQMHLYPIWSGRAMNLAHEEDIQLIINAVRRFAEAGATSIMVAVDDHTPRAEDQKTYTLPTDEEKARFNGSAGKAHGMIMRRLHDALRACHPDLTLTMVVAPYATENHGLRYPEVQRYFTDWASEAPSEVGLVWTGRNVFSPKTTLEEADQVKSLLNGNPLIMFSNSNGIAAPLPLWRTTFYPEMLRDSRGMILLWGSYFLRPLEKIYYLGANAYLWNPANYNADRDYKVAAAEPFLALQHSYQATMARRSTGNRKHLAKTFKNFEGAYNRAVSVQTPDGKPLPLEQVKGYLNYERSVLDYQPPILVVQEHGKAAVNLRPRGDRPDSEPPDNGYAQLCFDSSGNQFDTIAANAGYSFDPDWQVTTLRTSDGWRADVTIPYAAFENDPRLNFVKPAPGVIWRVNFHRVNNAKGLVSSFGTQGDGFHQPEWFGELHFSAAPSDVACEGSYPYHLQGVDMNEKGEYFWSFSDRIVKTDHTGKVIKVAKVGLHSGDLCCRDGKVYSSFSIIDDYGLGAEWGSIRVYDQKDLSLLAEHKIVDKLGCDGIAATPYGFVVSILLRPSVDQATTLLFTYDPEFKLQDTRTVNHGPVYSGIQSFKRLPEGGYIAAPYGDETLILDDNLNIAARYEFSMPDGIVPSGARTGISAHYNSRERGDYRAYLSSYDLTRETER